MPPTCRRPAELARRWPMAAAQRRPSGGRAVAQAIAPARAAAPRPSRRARRAETPRAETRRAEPVPREARPQRHPAADDEPAEAPAPLPELKSFEDVVALAEAKRDLKLKHALLEQVRLVRFKPGTIEINPLPQAPRELGQELMRKLKAWTGRVWIVAVSDEEGAAPLGAPAPREGGARDRDSPRASGRQAGDAAFPRRAHRRGAAGGRARAASRRRAEEREEFKEDGTN